MRIPISSVRLLTGAIRPYSPIKASVKPNRPIVAFKRGVECAAAVRINRRDRALRLLVRSRIDMAQDFLKRIRMGADQYGLVLGIRKIVQFNPAPDASLTRRLCRSSPWR